MVDVSIIELRFQRKKIGEALAAAQKYMVGVPKGSVVYRKIGGKTRYYKVDGQQKDRKEIYISTEHIDEVLPLVRKRYYSALITRLTNEAEVLDCIIEKYNPDAKYLPLLDVPAEYRNQIDALVLPMSECCRRWEAAPFECSTFPKEEGSMYETPHGEVVRSRAEYIIADILRRLGLAYHYEERISLNIGGKKYDLYPDFTIMHPRTGMLYYLEFFGMMDQPNYMMDAFAKIKKYQAANLGARLISIFDSNGVPMDNVVVETMIMNYFGIKKK